MKNKKIIKRMISYPLKNKFLYFVTLLLFSCQDFIFTAYVLFMQFYAINIIENKKTGDIFKVAFTTIGLYGVITILMCMGMLLIDYLNIKTENLLKYDILKNVVYRKSRDIDVSNINSCLINDTSTVVSFLTYQIGLLLMPIVSLIGCFVIVFIINIKIGLLVLGSVWIPLIYNILVLPKIKNISSRIVNLNSEYLNKIIRGIKAFSTIKLFNLVNNQIEFTKNTREEVKKNQIIRNNLYSIRTLISNITNVIVTFIVMVIAIGLYNCNSISLAEIVIIPQLLSGILAGIEGVCSFSLSMQQPIASAKRIFKIIDEEIIESIGSKTNKYIESNVYYEVDAVKVSNLSFGYNEKVMIFNNLSFNIKNHQITCLFGPIGCGKSTIIKLIIGFLTEKNGDIKVFNQNKKMINERDWFNNFALVEQEPTLFNLSIEENILLGNIDENKDCARMNEILKNTGLDDVIKQLPDGLKTIVGSRGTSISGGQKQLVCLARALYSKSPIIVLDEFSSAMDKSIEKKVFNALQYYKKDRAFIIISHRNSCLENADNIIKITK